MSAFRKGNMVEVVKSKHVDVMVGDCGVVENVMQDGYAVRIYGSFASASDVNARKDGERTIFFPDDALKQPEGKLLDPKLVATLQLLQKAISQKRGWPQRLSTSK